MGHINAFSFCQDKIMTTGGEGGMVTTNDNALWSRAWSYKDHGKNYEAAYQRENPPGFRWLHESFGTNWRLTEMQSALGRHMLRKLDTYVERRRELAATLNRLLPQSPRSAPRCLRTTYTIPITSTMCSFAPRDCAATGIGTGSWLLSKRKAFRVVQVVAARSTWRKHSNGIRPRQLPVAKELGETGLMFMVHPTLSEDDMHDAADAVAKVLAVAVR